MRPARSLVPRPLARAAAAALVLAAGACSGGGGSSPVDVDPDFGSNDPALVVALGDSITFGIYDDGVESCDEANRGDGGFEPDLEALTGKTVINEGVCGEDSYGGRDRIESVLAQHRPGVILIDYSPNDMIYGADVLLSNLRSMVATARNRNTVPVLGTMTPAVGDHSGWESFIESANAKILALCEEQGIECADHHQAFVNDPRYKSSPYTLLTDDGLHPNAAGFELMAKTWRWPLLRVY